MDDKRKNSFIRPSVPVVKVDKLTGKIVEHYPSCKKAAIANGVPNPTLINSSRNGKLIYGRYFYRKEGAYDPNENWAHVKNRPVIGINKQLGVIRHFIGIQEAVSYTNTSMSSVSQSITGHTEKRKDGWQFRYQASPTDWVNVKAKAEAAGIVAIDADTEGK